MRAGGQQAWPQDVAVPRRAVPQRAAVPVARAWVLPLAEAQGWFKSAAIGEVLLYAGGPRLIQGETSHYFRDLALAGLAHPIQLRLTDRIGYEYEVRKLGDERPPAAPPAEMDAALEAIFAAIERAAEDGARCPSDAELARAAGLATRAAAQGRVVQLRKARRILSEPVTGPFDDAQDRQIGRVVTIVATGKRTRAPKGWGAPRG
jgi:hypothetical protein